MSERGPPGEDRHGGQCRDGGEQSCFRLSGPQRHLPASGTQPLLAAEWSLSPLVFGSSLQIKE